MKMMIAGMMAAGLMRMGLGRGGCVSETGKRADMDAEVRGNAGLQARDLREMTDQMAPDLLQIPEITRNPYKVTVVMKPPENHLEAEAGKDLSIYVARLKSLLNTSQTRDRILFVEQNETLRNFQSQELGGRNTDPFETAGRTNTPPPVDPRILPQFVLTGKFYEKHGGRASYFFCTFDLLDINTGALVWEKSYEVQRLN